MVFIVTLPEYGVSCLCAQGQQGTQSFAQQQQLLEQGGNVSILYSLSVVQLSDPSHADMLALFATANGEVRLVMPTALVSTLECSRLRTQQGIIQWVRSYA